MRFYYDFTLLNGTGSDPRACYFVGQNVTTLDDLFYTCQESDVLTPEFESLFRNYVLPAITETFSAVLQVKYPEVGNLLLGNDSDMCYTDVYIPKRYTTVGVDTDYILFPSVRPADPDVVAYALACQIDNVNRPIAGHINFNPTYFYQLAHNKFDEFAFANAIRVGIHELTHALGFSSNLYPYYIDSSGHSYSTPVTAQKTLVNRNTPSGVAYNSTVTLMKTPNVVNYARAHYNCSTLDGVELEDFGGSGTAGSHWETRMASKEYMCGYVGDYMVISGFTLSLFQDMGWYIVDKSKAEYYGWGKGLGCGFAQDQCQNSWPANQGYWCDSIYARTGCSGDRLGKASCSIRALSAAVRRDYQHFTNATLIGLDVAADCCPYYMINSPCHNKNNTGNEDIYEVYSSSSMCWEYSTGASSVTFADMASNAACWEHSCTYVGDNATLSLKINGTFFKCPQEGGIISVDPVMPNGFVNCPKTSLLCEKILGFGVGDNLVEISDPATSTSSSTSDSTTNATTGSTSTSGSTTKGADEVSTATNTAISLGAIFGVLVALFV